MNILLFCHELLHCWAQFYDLIGGVPNLTKQCMLCAKEFILNTCLQKLVSPTQQKLLNSLYSRIGIFVKVNNSVVAA